MKEEKDDVWEEKKVKHKNGSRAESLRVLVKSQCENRIDISHVDMGLPEGWVW
jgi:hypothetical protein